jgi:flagellar biosynthesis/type III secretory pathway chaperone
MTLSPVETLLETLETEAEAIKFSRYQELGPIQKSITVQMEQLHPDQHPSEALQQVRTKLQANQALLQAAIGGLNAARARVAELLQVQQGLSVYDQSGNLATVPTGRKGLERKA